MSEDEEDDLHIIGSIPIQMCATDQILIDEQACSDSCKSPELCSKSLLKGTKLLLVQAVVSWADQETESSACSKECFCALPCCINSDKADAALSSPSKVGACLLPVDLADGLSTFGPRSTSIGLSSQVTEI